MLGCRPASSPIDPMAKYGVTEEEELVDRGSYQRLVGRLIYLSHTRLDLAFAVSVVSQFMHAPRQSHLNVVHHILRYLKATPGKGLFFRKRYPERSRGLHRCRLGRVY